MLGSRHRPVYQIKETLEIIGEGIHEDTLYRLRLLDLLN